MKEFAGQTTLQFPKSYSLDSAKLNFFIPANHEVKMVTVHPKLDTLKYQQLIGELTVGSSVGVDFFLKDTLHQRPTKQTIHYVISVMEHKPSLPIENEQFRILTEREYLSGTIYFSNPPMHDVFIYSVKSGDTKELTKLFGLLKPGGIVTFDKVTLREKSGQTSILNETVKIE